MDAYGDEWKDSDEDSEQDEESAPTKFKPSYVLIAIDTEKSMFATDNSDQSPFADCLSACYKLASSLVMADRGSIKGPVGIVLADNDLARASFVEFDQSILDTVRFLKDLASLSNDELKRRYQRKTDFDLADFFLLCKNKLVNVNADVYRRSVVYITNDENPIQDDPRKRFKVINESQKFASVQMDLHVATFKANFDSDVLFGEVLSASNSSPVANVSCDDLAEKLCKMVQKRYVKYKSKFYPFRGDTDRYFEVFLNKFLKSAYIAKNMHVTRDTQQEVKKSIKQQDYTGNYNVMYSKKEPPLVITENEKHILSETNLPIGYTFLCVGEETLQRGWVIEAPVLMEKNDQETLPIFDSFWQFCKDKFKCLICLRKYKKGGDVRVVELVPKFINDTRMFLAKTMPFGPEIHYPSRPTEVLRFEKEEEDAMTALVDALTFNFNPYDFVDPVNGKKKAYLKSQLLEEPLEKIPDAVPSDLEIDKKIADQIQGLHKMGLIDDMEASSSGKRSLAVKNGSTQRKKKAA